MSVRAKLVLWRCLSVGHRVTVRGRVWIHGDGDVIVGDDVVLDGANAPIELRTRAGARLSIGDRTTIGGGTSIEAEGKLFIGDDVQVGAFSKIIDSHFHRVTGDRHQRREAGEVVIGDGAVLEPYCIVIPNAVIGPGATVAARTVVSKKVPRGAYVVGNPARVLPERPKP